MNWAINAGVAIGSPILTNVCNLPAPSIFAASKMESGTLIKNSFINITATIPPKNPGTSRGRENPSCPTQPKVSKNKYELDKETGHLILDRVLFTSTHYPANYGLIPLTYADDGDPLDVLVLCSEPILPMSMVRCRPIGVMRMIDSGALDEKIIAVPFGDPNYADYTDIDQLPSHVFSEMRHFFSVYKNLEGKQTVVNEVEPASKARIVIEKSLRAYQEKFGVGV